MCVYTYVDVYDEAEEEIWILSTFFLMYIYMNVNNSNKLII